MSTAVEPERRTGLRRIPLGVRIGLAVAALAVAVAVLGADRVGGRGGLPELEPIPDILRAAGAFLALTLACGYAPARLLCPAALLPHRALLVLPLGAAVAGLALTLLGAAKIPLEVSVWIVLAGGAMGAVAVRRREPGLREPGDVNRSTRVVLPALIALGVTLLVISPMVRNDSFATVLGQNGDAHLATGTAELLQHAEPGAERTELPVDRMPAVWNSKYPIYYVLAGVSTLSGLDPIQTFGTVIAFLAGLTVIGFFLLAVHVLGAGPRAALVAAGLVALCHVLYRLSFDPFYNNLWALFAFPFVLVTGWHFLHRPGRRSLILFATFAAVAVFAYPLLVPFPVLFLGVAGYRIWKERRAAGESPGWIAALRLPRGRRSLWLWVPLGIVLLPIGLFLVGSALEKMWQATEAALPGGDLSAWTGKTPGFHPLAYFLGLPEGLWIGTLVLLGLALAGLRRLPRDVALPLGVMLGALLLGAWWFHLRGAAALFHFRALVFFAPTALVLVGLALTRGYAAGDVWLRRGAYALTAVVAVLMVGQVRGALSSTFPQVDHNVMDIRDWSERLPEDSSVRVDLTPVGIQQWGWYMLADHPVSASDPLRYFYPHAPISRKADYLLVNRSKRPNDAVGGAPLFENGRFALYRLDPEIPGPDRSSQKFVIPPAVGGE